MSAASPTSPEPWVRLAAHRDIEALVELMREFHAESGYPLDHAWASASFRDLLRTPALGRAWLACCGATPVGSAVLTLRYSMEFGGLSGHLDDLFVRPAFRGRHVGQRLVSALFDECRNRGCKSVHVEAAKSNASALALYRKFGLQPVMDERISLVCALPGEA